MKEINELFMGIIHQSRMLRLKHNCGGSENLVYMATELKDYFDKYKEEEKRKLNEAIDILENVL